MSQRYLPLKCRELKIGNSKSAWSFPRVRDHTNALVLAVPAFQLPSNPRALDSEKPPVALTHLQNSTQLLSFPVPTMHT